MKKIIASLPNTLTLMNLLCGLFALTFAFEGNFEMVFWAVIGSAMFDFLDGFAARALKAYSAIGADLDSLSDMVSFGAVPGVVIYQLLEVSGFAWPWMGFLVTLFSALRLAKFNNDSRQSEEFRGLAVPASALMVVSVAAFLVNSGGQNLRIWAVLSSSWFLVSLGVVLSGLLVSDFVMFSLKFKSFGIKANALRYLFLAISIVVLIFGGWLSLAIIVILYILMSLITLATRKK